MLKIPEDSYQQKKQLCWLAPETILFLMEIDTSHRSTDADILLVFRPTIKKQERICLLHKLVMLFAMLHD